MYGIIIPKFIFPAIIMNVVISRHHYRFTIPPAQVRVAVISTASIYRAPSLFPVRGRVPWSRRRPYRPRPAFGSVSATRTGVAAVARHRSAVCAATSRRATVAALKGRDAVAIFRRATEDNYVRLNW